MSGEVGDDVHDASAQRMIWEKRWVSRDKILNFIADAVGLDPKCVRSVMMRPDVVEIEEIIRDEDGKPQLHPRIPDTLWTRVRVFHID